MYNSFRDINVAKILQIPGKFDPDAIDYTVATRPLTPDERRLICYFKETEHAVASGYHKDITAYRSGITPGIIEEFMERRWVTEETSHGNGLQRRLGADAHLQGMAPELLINSSEPDRGEAELRLQKCVLVLKRYALKGVLGAAHQTPFDEKLTSLVNALHMTIGGTTELMANRSYGFLGDLTQDPVLQQMIPDIRADERKHESFYFALAFQIMDDDTFIRSVVRELLPRAFAPVGVGLGYHKLETFGFVADQMQNHKRGGNVAKDVDDVLSELLSDPTLSIATDGVAKATAIYRQSREPLATA